MKSLPLTLALAAFTALSVTVGAGQANAGRLEAREAALEHRYEHGRRSGSITYLEGIRLRRELANYRKLKNSFGANGHISRQERRLLARKLHAAKVHVRGAETNPRHRVGFLPRVGR